MFLLKNKLTPAVTVIVLTCIGFTLRLYKLGYHDLWFDEVCSILVAKSPASTLHLPLYYILLSYWIKLLGVNEFIVRIPSLIFNTASIPLIFILGKSILNKRIALISTFILTFSPLHIWYSQEARSYSMTLFIGLLSSILWFNALNTKKKCLFIAFFLINILGIYTNWSFLLLAFAQFCFGIIFFKTFKIKRVLLIYLLFLIFFIFTLLSKIFSVVSHMLKITWLSKPPLKYLLILIENFNLGYNVTILIFHISAIVTLFIGISIIVAFLKNKISEKEKVGLAFILFLFIFPILLSFLFSKLITPVLITRTMFIFTPYYYLFLSMGLANIKFPWIKKGLYIVVISLTCLGLGYYYLDKMEAEEIYHRGTPLKKPVKPVVNFLIDNIKKTDIIVHTNYHDFYTFDFYLKKNNKRQYYIVSPTAEAYVKNQFKNAPFKINFSNLLTISSNNIWLICSNYQKNKKLTYENSLTVKKWMDKNFILESSKIFDGIWIYKYNPPKNRK